MIAKWAQEDVETLDNLLNNNNNNNNIIYRIIYHIKDRNGKDCYPRRRDHNGSEMC